MERQNATPPHLETYQSQVEVDICLPTVGPPYPDELLGSWLARLVALNAYSSFIACFQHIFPGEHFNSGELTNIFGSSSRIEALLVGLGWKSNDALFGLTTYPYWTRFESSSVASDSIQRDEKLATRYAIGSQPTKAVLRREVGKNSTLRICPQCMRTDRYSVGGPYFHRTHQLPLVRCCIIHRCELLTACPRCFRSFGGQIFPEALRPNCPCGYALDTIGTIILDTGNPWLRLAAVSAEALNGRPVHPLPYWLELLPRRVKEMRPDRQEQFMPLLRACYGSEWLSWISKDWTIAAPTPSNSEPITFASASLRAPHICAIIAAARFDLCDLEATAKKQSHRCGQSKSQVAVREGARRVRLARPVDVVDARRQALSVIAQLSGTITMKALSRKHPTLYWYLVLSDTAWLMSTFAVGCSSAPSIPTIEADRARIEAMVRAHRDKLAAKRLVLSSSVLLRAQIRDSEWLSSKRQEYARQSQEIAEMNLAKLFAASHEKVLRWAGRPVRISIVSLASAAGVRRSKISTFVHRNPQLRDFCTESAEGFAARCIKWAVAELVRTNTLMSATDIVSFAGQQCGKRNADLAREELAKAGLPILRAGRGQAPIPSGFKIVRPLLRSRATSVQMSFE